MFIVIVQQAANRELDPCVDFNFITMPTAVSRTGGGGAISDNGIAQLKLVVGICIVVSLLVFTGT